ncbi:hypothetical protein KIH87_04305 [Paraneptunicella aestuarii]|uniref:hypothetical protein n=1 Tax=Paraneptunicella aestuarii TaxID=2831148 RepID=UPI001E4D56A8|nr:hypothetical protein [Paraneptunicella aestuarii]UAA39587.1 hypothetical protein KIH87_04305 [Paraneptunicella aestuarii]
MREIQLPDAMSDLVKNLQIVQLHWRNVPIQIPKFAVYAILDQPVFDSFMYRDKRRVGLIKVKNYVIPVIDPFRGSLNEEPKHVVVVSHCKGNRFGLFGYPADNVDPNVSLPFYHRSVKHIVKDFV